MAKQVKKKDDAVRGAHPAHREIIKFIRRKDFELRGTLGSGACGQTVLLYDPQIDQHYVCKKYAPADDRNRLTLFENFVRETRLLHKLHHRNVVRVFNHFLYPEQFAGYILMEYVQGTTLGEYLALHPEAMSDLFEQAVEGFSHLEANNVLHRDIRDSNILVTDEGVLKIIDFGFGKQALVSTDFEKSISLNWWCTVPAEFSSGTYDFCTEVYFVGMLFREIMEQKGLSDFRYPSTLAKMCKHSSENRLKSFADTRKHLFAGRLQELEFSEEELVAYREFSSTLAFVLGEIDQSAKYESDLDRLVGLLETLYRKVMLEEHIPNVAQLLSVLINGRCTYYRQRHFPVETLKAFINLLKASSPERRSIILANIHAKLDAVDRIRPSDPNDDIPF